MSSSNDFSDYLLDVEFVYEQTFSETEEGAYEVARRDARALRSELDNLINDGSFVSEQAKAAVVGSLRAGADACQRLGYGGLAIRGERLATDAESLKVVAHAA
ncbi:MAG TPA: hypothetical protein VHL98_14585 [Microvirga sp.]|jgi:hypothetical protein|nr:hypothetical protein [Microvirga sp.]